MTATQMPTQDTVPLDTEPPIQGTSAAANWELPEGVLPRRGFITAYVAYAREQTDAPPIFHVGVSTSLVGAASGNRVGTQAWGRTIRCHLWNLLIARSSYFRKTTAISIGTDLLPGEALLANDFTRERFVEQMQERPGGLIVSGEFAAMLAALGRDYMGGTRELLTEFYDSPREWSRQLQGKTVRIESPAPSILGASTLDWIQKRVTAGDLRGGFLPRFLIWHASDKPPRRGLIPVRSAVIEQELRANLKRIMHLPPTSMALDRDAHRAYDEWLERHEREDVDAEFEGFHQRLETAALKLAMIYQLSIDVPAGIEPRTLMAEQMRCALGLVDLLWANARSVFAAGLSGTRYGAELSRVEEMVGHNGGILQRDLLRKTHLTLRELTPLVETLVASGAIRCVSVRTHRGPASVRYVTARDSWDRSDRSDRSTREGDR